MRERGRFDRLGRRSSEVRAGRKEQVHGIRGFQPRNTDLEELADEAPPPNVRVARQQGYSTNDY